MYKDKDKQREANRKAMRRLRDKNACSAMPGYKEGYEQAIDIACGDTPPVIPKTDIRVIPKRGKDIKCFEDLPPDVQQTIDSLSVVEGKIDKTVKANRTAIAVNYQHLLSDKYYPQSAVISSLVVTGKPTERGR